MTPRPSEPSLHPDALDGTISDYNEQGMEAYFLWVFTPDEGIPNQPPFYTLGPGDVLAIFGADGALLFHGEVQARRRRWWQKPLHPSAPQWSPASVPYAQWYAWFRTRPALRARWYRPPSA